MGAGMGVLLPTWGSLPCPPAPDLKVPGLGSGKLQSGRQRGHTGPLPTEPVAAMTAASDRTSTMPALTEAALRLLASRWLRSCWITRWECCGCGRKTCWVPQWPQRDRTALPCPRDRGAQVNGPWRWCSGTFHHLQLVPSTRAIFKHCFPGWSDSSSRTFALHVAYPGQAWV